jgi:hypothetical protein
VNVWVWIYKEELDFYRVKIQISDRYFYFAAASRYYPASLSNLLESGIYENRSSAREQWKKKEGLLWKDYVSVSREECLKIIFMGAPLEERKVRNEVLRSLGVFDRKIQVSVFIYPNCFDLKIKSYVTINFYNRRLLRRSLNKRMKNVVGWMKRAIHVNVPGDYLCYPGNYYMIPLPDFLWFLEDEGKEDYVRRILEDIE